MIPIIAGHNLNSPGAKGYDGVYEHTRTSALQSRIIDKTESYLALTGTCMEILTDNDKHSLSRVINIINKEATGPGCDIHFNNNYEGATGIEVFVSRKALEETKNRATWIVNEGGSILDIPVRQAVASRDYKYPDESHLGSLAIIEQTKVDMILIEVCFLNDIDLPKYKGKEKDIADIIRLAHFHHTFNNVVPLFNMPKKMIRIDPKIN